MQLTGCRLGMPYYKILESSGEIVVTQIKELRFEDEDDRFSDILVDGRPNEKFLLSRHFRVVLPKAIQRIEELLGDKDQSISHCEELRQRLDRYQNDPNSVREKLEQEMSACTLIDHFPLGTKLWYVEPSFWRISVGSLVRLDSYDPKNSAGCPQYKNGQYRGVTHTRWFFDSKQEALDALACEVEERLPVKLVPNKVRIQASATLEDVKLWATD